MKKAIIFFPAFLFLILVSAAKPFPAEAQDNKAAWEPVQFIPPGLDFVKLATEKPYDTFTIGEDTQSFTEKRYVKAFEINRYETTYQLWHNICIQAELKFGYEFANAGQESSKGKIGSSPSEHRQFEPVTNITWYDAIVWCNAASEIYGYKPCYTYKGKILRSSFDTAECDLCTCDFEADGIRLPTETEWEYAARKLDKGFQDGSLCSGVAVAKFYGLAITEQVEDNFSWNANNSDGTREVGTTGTPINSQVEPGSGCKNGAGLFDMSGNVLEYCWDWYADYLPAKPGERSIGPEYGSERISRGGSFSIYTMLISCGDRYSYDPNEAYNYMGFRVARTVSSYR